MKQYIIYSQNLLKYNQKDTLTKTLLVNTGILSKN